MKKFTLTLALFLSVNSLAAEAALIDEETFKSLASRCAATVAPETLYALVKTESSFNPFAIGVVGGYVKQATNLQDALALVQKLEREEKNYSIGLGQINKSNFSKLGLTAEQLFDPCVNLTATTQILSECYVRTEGAVAVRLGKALSCYYSGNEQTGFRLGYVDRVKNNAALQTQQIPSIYLMNNSGFGDDERSVHHVSQLIISVNEVKKGLIF